MKIESKTFILRGDSCWIEAFVLTTYVLQLAFESLIFYVGHKIYMHSEF